MKLIKIFATITLLMIATIGFSQETSRVKARRKALEKQGEEKKKAADKSIEEGKARHLNIQTKEVKKRMKKNKKRNKKMHKKKGKARQKK